MPGSLGVAATTGCALPLLLAVLWLATWVFRGRVGRNFFALAAGLAVLCFPAGFVAAAVQTGHWGQQEGACVLHEGACYPYVAVEFWLNGLLGGVGCLVLAVLTALVMVIRRQERRERDAISGPVPS